MQLASVVQSSPGLEYLQELSAGSFGALWLARLTMGSEVGRLVVARRIKTDRVEASRIDSVLTAAQSYGALSHPSLVKLLGVYRTQTELIWVEEQVISVPLGKLHDLARAQQTSIPIHIATKLVLDAVRASDALRRSCHEQGLPTPEQMIFPDSLMVANFGEGLLAGAGVSNELCQWSMIRQHRDLVDVMDTSTASDAADERRDIFTAGATLWKLLAIPGLFDNYSNQQTLDLVLHSGDLKTEFAERLNLCAPKPLAQIIRKATMRDRSRRFRTLQELKEVLECLPAPLLANDSQVRNWLTDVAGDYLSDVQRSSGVRRVPLNLRAPVAPSAFTGRPSYTPTPLPGFHTPFAPKTAPAETMPTILAASEAPPEGQGETLDLPVESAVSYPPPPAPKRHTVRTIAIAFLLLGAGMAVGYTYLTGQTNLQRWLNSSASRPTATQTKAERSRAGATAPPLGVALPAHQHRDTAPDITAPTAPSSSNASSEVEESKASSGSRRATHAKAAQRAPAPASTNGSTNRWGI